MNAEETRAALVRATTSSSVDPCHGHLPPVPGFGAPGDPAGGRGDTRRVPEITRSPALAAGPDPAVARSVTIGVLALQGAVREHRAVLDQLGLAAIEVRGPKELDRVDGLILPGGESTTMSMLIESSGLLPDLQRRLDEGMPALGTCAGMILLAAQVADGRPDQHLFGAIDIAVRRNAFGRQVDSFETDLAVEGLATPLHAVFIRAPLVERVGPGVEVLARVEGADGAARPVVCRQGSVLVAAFHPELVADPRLHQMFAASVAEVARVAESGAGTGSRWQARCATGGEPASPPGRGGP